MLKKVIASVVALALVLAIVPINIAYADTPLVEVWVSQVNSSNTGMAKGLEKQSDLQFSADDGSKISNLIAVNENNTYQSMDGFGASITEASASLYQKGLSATDKQSLMNALFSKGNGIGLSMLRQPIGATDHCVAPYNFAPTQQADNLPNFDFSHELKTIFPTVKDALAVEPGRVKIMATSWSPPGWMKNNNSEYGMSNGTKGSLKSDKYQAYANYLTKFIQEYQSRGVPIYAVTPTNEPDNASYIWPSLPMTHSEAQNLVKNYLYPTLRSNNLNTKIMAWDHSYTTTNYKDGSYPFQYYADADTKAKTDGTAWHWYEGDEETMSVVHKEFPDKDIWFTEGSGGEWGFPKWKTAFLNQSSCAINIARNWSKSIIYWNLALDENGGPDYYYDVNSHADSTNRGLVTINRSTGKWSYNVDYYTLGHVSKFVEPNAVRIDSTSLDNNIETVAFKNPDGSKVLVMTNLLAQKQAMKVLWGDQSLNYEIPAESMVTIKWRGTQTGSSLQPVWYNTLESNTNYYAGASATVASAASTANLGGSTGVKLTTTENGDPGDSKQCAVIFPQAGTTFDASGQEYLMFSVKDMVNSDGCTVKVTFVDQNNKISSAWSHEKTVYKNWTRIWVPVGGSAGFDRQHIKEIRIGTYWKGEYNIDDLSFALGYSDGIPRLGSANLLTNASFEDDGCKINAPKGWHFDGSNKKATYLEKNSNAASGRFHLVHYSASAFDAYTWQTVNGLENGTYTLRAMVQSGGGQTLNKVIATDFGSTELNVALPISTQWVQVEIPNIAVTNNQCTLGFYTQGNAGNWSCLDNVEFLKK